MLQGTVEILTEIGSKEVWSSVPTVIGRTYCHFFKVRSKKITTFFVNRMFLFHFRKSFANFVKLIILSHCFLVERSEDCLDPKTGKIRGIKGFPLYFQVDFFPKSSVSRYLFQGFFIIFERTFRQNSNLLYNKCLLRSRNT